MTTECDHLPLPLVPTNPDSIGQDSLPGINQSWLICRTPAEVFDARHVRSLLVESSHILDRQELKRLPITSTVGKEVE